MQTPVTVVMLLHDTATEADQPVCKVLTGCSWRETRRTSASGDPQRVVHIRLPPAPGYLPYPQWARLPPAEKAVHWTLKRGSKLLCGAVRSLCSAPRRSDFPAVRFKPFHQRSDAQSVPRSANCSGCLPGGGHCVHDSFKKQEKVNP